MKKIMFNDRFCLTQAVLDGRKTMTRRIVSYKLINEFGLNKFNDKSFEIIQHTNLKIGEIVAVAQSYKNAGYASDTIQEGRAVRKSIHSEDWDDSMIGKLGEWYIDQLEGWNNKMFTHPEMMPHKIRITDIRIERLQDISEDDCLKEGIIKNESGFPDVYYFFDNKQSLWNGFPSAIEAFAVLIDKVSGKGTWDSNPYVVAYSFV